MGSAPFSLNALGLGYRARTRWSQFCPVQHFLPDYIFGKSCIAIVQLLGQILFRVTPR